MAWRAMDGATRLAAGATGVGLQHDEISLSIVGVRVRVLGSSTEGLLGCS